MILRLILRPSKLYRRFYSSLPGSTNVFTQVLNSDKCQCYLNDVEQSLLKFKSGELKLDPKDDFLINKWESIVKGKCLVQQSYEEFNQLRELEKPISEDKAKLEAQLDDHIDDLVVAIVPLQQVDQLSKCQMEFTSGAGGVESMMFAEEILEMYSKLALNKGWKWSPFQVEAAPQGGIRSALVMLEGLQVYNLLRFEAGVHRVQRIPKTDTSRMHTSTMSVAVLPEPEETNVEVLSSDCKVETMRASGPGGQNVNKRSSAVRITHQPSGIVVHCMQERFQHLNIQLAYKRIGAILLQQQVDEVESKISSSRRLQVGSRARAEKVRTYNFQNDRVTDHRLKQSTSNLADFMNGGPKLEQFIDGLRKLNLLERLQEELDQNVSMHGSEHG